eukprot:Sspe_Gene.111013::Locus_92189_Transcript_2_2_Confidence_0.400_Length_1185::g.111013::m.111013
MGAWSPPCVMPVLAPSVVAVLVTVVVGLADATCPPRVPAAMVIPTPTRMCHFFIGEYSTNVYDACVRDYGAWAGVLPTEDDVIAVRDYVLANGTRTWLSGECQPSNKYSCTWMDGTTVEPTLLNLYALGEPDKSPGNTHLGLLGKGFFDFAGGHRTSTCTIPANWECDGKVPLLSSAMSSVASIQNCPPSNCIDANVGPGTGDCSTVPSPRCMSDREDYPWIEVALPQGTVVSAVRVYPTDISTFAGNFQVLTSTDRLVWKPCVSRGRIEASPTISDFLIPCSATARYVRVQLDGADRTLDLREIEVLGCPPSTTATHTSVHITPTPTTTSTVTPTPTPSLTKLHTATPTATPTTTPSLTSTPSLSPTSSTTRTATRLITPT